MLLNHSKSGPILFVRHVRGQLINHVSEPPIILEAFECL
jgi:hypothetical protein